MPLRHSHVYAAEDNNGQEARAEQARLSAPDCLTCSQRCRILIDQRVSVLPKTSERDAWRAGERGQGSFGRYEHPVSQGNQFADGHAVARDDE